MHPEVRQVGPGSCPICGMALEPEQVSLDDAPDPELIDMTRRFRIALVLTLPVFVIEMGSHLGLMHLVPPGWSNWISFVLTTPVVLWAGAPFFARGWSSLLTRYLNMFTLIAMGTGVPTCTAWSARWRRSCSRPHSATNMAWSRCILRPRPSSRFWCCWGRCWNCGRAQQHLRRDPRAARPGAENRAAHHCAW